MEVGGRRVLERWVNNGMCMLTLALKLDAAYLKALHRRAVANDKLGTWSSLTAAQEGKHAALVDLSLTI